jgi:Protein of unknown function (DUF3341)
VPRSFLVATFSDPDDLVRAAYAVREADFRIHDIYAPFPIHGLDQAIGIRRTRLPWVTLVIGSGALLCAVLFQFYTTVLDWSLNVGGKPDNSTLAFIPITFELTVLFGGLATFVAFLVRAQLYPGKREELAAVGVTNDSFALVLRKRDPLFNTARASELLERCNACAIEEKESHL